MNAVALRRLIVRFVVVTSSAAITSIKMASMYEKALYVLWYHETNSTFTVQQRSKNEYERGPPYVKIFKYCYAKFKNHGSVCDLKRTGRPMCVLA